MAHVRASGSAGRSSSQKKSPRLVPPLIITVRIYDRISTSSSDKIYAHVTLLANESASRIGPVTGRAQGIAPTMLRLCKPVRAWRQRNVSFPSPGHFTLCVIRQQRLLEVVLVPNRRTLGQCSVTNRVGLLFTQRFSIISRSY